MTQQQPLYKIKCLKGADEICAFIKEDSKNIASLVRDEKLPAWKRCQNGQWYAINVDLALWLIGQRNKYLKDTPKYLVNT